ncbi:hypothetical protein D3C84_689990 [compost metagenome]
MLVQHVAHHGHAVKGRQKPTRVISGCRGVKVLANPLLHDYAGSCFLCMAFVEKVLLNPFADFPLAAGRLHVQQFVAADFARRGHHHRRFGCGVMCGTERVPFSCSLSY